MSDAVVVGKAFTPRKEEGFDTVGTVQGTAQRWHHDHGSVVTTVVAFLALAQR
ncbi:hypothetical protein O9993_06535 [Vibrio lentus]|nr:hypothetical protein [Vibrio lentus]